jgi:hypothetical protein
VFLNIFLPTAHPTLTVAREGTPQNFALRKRVQNNTWPQKMRVYVNKKQSSPAKRHGDAWGERRYRSYSFTTSALDGVVWSASRPGRALAPGKDPRYPLYRMLGGPQSRLDTEPRGKILSPLPGIEL